MEHLHCHAHDCGIDYRWVIVYINLGGKSSSKIALSTRFRLTTTVNGIGILAPVITLIVYAADAYLRGGSPLDQVTAFTSISIVTLVTTPAKPCRKMLLYQKYTRSVARLVQEQARPLALRSNQGS